jgi:hypothetical protein
MPKRASCARRHAFGGSRRCAMRAQGRGKEKPVDGM